MPQSEVQPSSSSLPPFLQARYHLGCAGRHVGKAFDAVLDSRFGPQVSNALVCVRLWVPLFFLLILLLSGCSLFRPAPIVITPQQGSAAVRAEALDTAAQSRAAAAVSAAARANEANPAGAPRESTAGELGTAAANLPQPSPADLAAALSRVEAGLRGDLDSARRQWASAQGDAAGLRLQIVAAAAAAERERLASSASLEKLKADFATQLTAERRRAEADQQRLLGWIFYGGGAVLVLLGIGCLTVFASLPIVGPRVAASLIAAGFASIACGRAVAWMLAHPWAIVAGIAIPLAAAAALAMANHHHHHASAAPAPPL
jgi:hypothetical protein